MNEETTRKVLKQTVEYLEDNGINVRSTVLDASRLTKEECKSVLTHIKIINLRDLKDRDETA